MSDYKFDDPKNIALQQLMDSMDDERTEQHLQYIRTMSHLEMARLWRFAPSGHPYFNTDFAVLTNEFAKRWELLGGMTSEISKLIGWEE